MRGRRWNQKKKLTKTQRERRSGGKILGGEGLGTERTVSSDCRREGEESENSGSEQTYNQVVIILLIFHIN